MSYQDMDVAFHHMGMAGPSEVVKDLWEQGYILLHYENKASFDRSDYSKKPKDIDTFNSAVTSDVPTICLSRIGNNHYNTSKRILGVIPANADRFVVGIPNDRASEYCVIHDLEEAVEREDEFSHIYKATKLRDSDQKMLDGSNYFLSAYEIPSTTFAYWKPVRRQLRAIMAGEDLPPTLPTSYSTEQIELLCEEFLRFVKPDYVPLMQTGGAVGTHEVDILGETETQLILGEVKNTSSKPDDAFQFLKNISEEQEITSQKSVAFYLFSRRSPSNSVESVRHFSLESVLETLWENRDTRRVMKRMTANSISKA